MVAQNTKWAFGHECSLSSFDFVWGISFLFNFFFFMYCDEWWGMGNPYVGDF